MSDAQSRDSFLTTRWSIVRRAGEVASPDSREALDVLIRAYWFPLYAYVRRAGVEAHEAEDVVQAFFARTLEKNDLARLAPEHGRFRAFLMAAIKHFLSNWRDRERAHKRGGGRVKLAIDVHEADARLELEDRASQTPERAFERAWARELMRRAVDELRAEYVSSGRGPVFDVLAVELQQGGEASYAEHAERLGMTRGAVKVAVHRLRARFREKLRERIAETVEREEDVDDEIRALFAALAP